MLSTPLIPKHASANRPSWQWNDDDFDVLANGQVVGRIFKVCEVIEMKVLAAAAIITALAVPAFAPWHQSSQLFGSFVSRWHPLAAAP